MRRYLATSLKHTSGVSVVTFGAWARAQRAPSNLDNGEDYGRGLLRLLELGQGDAGKYDAVLIDEGQDFHPSWFASARLALQEPDTGSLIIAYDLSQNLYGLKPPKWSALGIRAVGRTRRIEINYRNTREIVSAAWSFGLPESPGDADTPMAVALRPDTCRRSGPWPRLYRTANEAAQISRCRLIVEDLLDPQPSASARGQGIRPADIMVLCRRKALVASLQAALRPLGAEIQVSTIHSARGLQSRVVIVVGAQEMLDEEGRALLYVALTRPTDELCVIWSHDTPLTKELVSNLKSARAAWGDLSPVSEGDAGG